MRLTRHYVPPQDIQPLQEPEASQQEQHDSDDREPTKLMGEEGAGLAYKRLLRHNPWQ